MLRLIGLKNIKATAGKSSRLRKVTFTRSDTEPGKESVDLHDPAAILEFSVNERIEVLSIKDSIDLVPSIIQKALDMDASDIHIEPGLGQGRIRFRIDGNLIIMYRFSMDEHSYLINRIKVMARLDIAERRVPQDGRISWDETDLRVSSIPVMYGEKLVLRILHDKAGNLGLEGLGMSPAQLSTFRRAFSQPNGLLLISGPTGSGKTSTMYAALNELNSEGINIITAEDPVEFYIPGLSQVQVKAEIGLDFATVLRSFLRQDPDIIMLGEIRDPETVSMAIRAALTGHLVLSTVHTNSASKAVTRLRDMGVAPYLIEDTLICAVAQRLLRKLCPLCKRMIRPQGSELLHADHVSSIYEPGGCQYCGNTGYRGRIGVFELIYGKHGIGEILRGDSTKAEIDGPIVNHGMNLVRLGITSSAELKRVFGPDGASVNPGTDEAFQQ